MNDFRKGLPKGRFGFKTKRALGKQNCRFFVMNYEKALRFY